MELRLGENMKDYEQAKIKAYGLSAKGHRGLQQSNDEHHFRQN